MGIQTKYQNTMYKALLIIAMLAVAANAQNMITLKCCLRRSDNTINVRDGNCQPIRVLSQDRKLQAVQPTRVPAYCPRRVSRRNLQAVKQWCSGYRRLTASLRKAQSVVRYECPTTRVISSYYRCYENTRRVQC